MPESIENLCQKARQQIAHGHIEQARQAYLQALGIRSDTPDVHYGLATACFLLNDLDSAAYHFKEVTRLDPLRPGRISISAPYTTASANTMKRFKSYAAASNSIRTAARGITTLGWSTETWASSTWRCRPISKPRETTRKWWTPITTWATSTWKWAGTSSQSITTSMPYRFGPIGTRAAGLNQAEAAQNASEPQTAAPAKQPVTVPPVEDHLNRQIDPECQGDLLTVLHHAAIDSEAHGRQFLQILEDQIEPAIKDLATRLLGVETSGPDLSQCIAMFENALENMRKTQQDLEGSISRVETLGDQLLKT